MTYQGYFLDWPSALCNTRKTIYQGPEVLKSDKYKIGRAHLRHRSMRKITPLLGKRVDRAPREQFEYYLVILYPAFNPFLHYYREGCQAAVDHWLTHDDPSRSNLFLLVGCVWR